jgi:hypothetical protein
MHVKKNVCEATCGTLLQQKSKGKDHKNAREDLKEPGIRSELYAEETETRTNLPVAATTLLKAERKEIYQFLHDLKVPSGYSSNFKRLVSVKDMKINFNLTKYPDFHVLMTALLPVAVRGIKTELVRDAVTSWCLFFNAIEQKVTDEEKLLDLERRHFETLCLLEATFPPSFFDLMLHQTTHLAKEIWFLGPSYLHQMFPYQRFYGFLKSLVHNRLFPKGAIVRGYKTIEAVETCGVVIADEISNLAAGPLFTVTRYEGMDINVYTFYTMTQDKKSVYQNSGVRVRAIVDDSHDDDGDTDTYTYYGEIE